MLAWKQLLRKISWIKQSQNMSDDKQLKAIEDIYNEFIEQPHMPMTLRIGVAGHIKLPENTEQKQWIREQIKFIYKNINSIVMSLAETEVAKTIYKKNSTPIFRLTSSLAEGADRLCLEPDLIELQNHEIACILPFSKDEFSKDFCEGKSFTNPKGTISEFENILQRANYNEANCRVMELDGNPEDRESAYLHCSKVLVEHSDILIVLYNGEDNGDKGTTATINSAKKKGIPIIHISTKEKSTSLLSSGNFGHKANMLSLSENNLRTELSQLLLFDDIFSGQNKDNQEQQLKRKKRILDRFERYSGGSILTHSTKVIDFDNSGPIELNPKKTGHLANLFPKFKTLIAPKIDSLQTKNHTTEQKNNPSSHLFYAAYLRADRLANFYSNLHRSTYLSIYLLGTIALVLAIMSFTINNHHLLTLTVSIKLLLLVSIFCLYWRDHKNDYHGRWLEYRFLSESLRPTYYLIELGATYSFLNSHDTKIYQRREILGHHRIGRGWLYIYLEILTRYAGFNNCKITPEHSKNIGEFAKATWIDGQINYHNNNANIMKGMSERLGNWGINLFYMTVAVVLVKLAKLVLYYFNIKYGLLTDISGLFAVLAAIFPILATTGFMIRNHAEFEISAQRSLTIKSCLATERESLKDEELHQSSILLANHLENIALMTTEKVAEWLEIYEVKKTEPA